MRIVVQRVTHARITIPGRGDISGKIDSGLVVMAGFQQSDTDQTTGWAADKIANLRILPDERGRMHRSLLEVEHPQALLVPNFTIACNIGKGRRPGFEAAMPPDRASVLFRLFVENFAEKGIDAQAGVFGAEMHVTLCNDGPVTFVLETGSQTIRPV